MQGMKLTAIDEEPVLQVLMAPQRMGQRARPETLMPAPALRPTGGVQVDVVRLAQRARDR